MSRVNKENKYMEGLPISERCGGGPLNTGTAYELIAGNSNTRAFAVLLARADPSIRNRLASMEAPLTVFVPSDLGLANVADGSLAFIVDPTNARALDAILRYHIVPGLSINTASMGHNKIRTEGGETLIVKRSRSNGRVRVDTNAYITLGNLPVSNGIVHIVDRILSPMGEGVKMMTLDIHHRPRSRDTGPVSIQIGAPVEPEPEPADAPGEARGGGSGGGGGGSGDSAAKSGMMCVPKPHKMHLGTSSRDASLDLVEGD